MGMMNFSERPINPSRLRAMAHFSVGWAVMFALIPDFLFRLFNYKIPWVTAPSWAISILLFTGLTGYLCIRLFRERQVSLLISTGVLLILLSQSFRVCVSLGVFDAPAVIPWHNTMRAFDNFVNGLGIAIIGLAFLYVIIEITASRQALLSEHARLTEEVTRREQAEQEYKAILQTAMDGFWIVDLEGRILDVNEAYCRFIGYSREELLTMRISDLEAVETQEDITRHIQEVREKGMDRFETRHRRKDGAIIDVEISSNAALQADRNRQCVFLRDITQAKQAEEQRKNLEAQVQYAQKLESLGVLAGGIAHDFNNILQIILVNLNQMQASLPGDSPVLSRVNNIHKSLERAAALTNQMLAYAGRRSLSLKLLDLGDITGEIIQLIRSSISKKVTLHVNLKNDLPLIEADGAQIEQVAMNLILNASESLDKEQGGVVTISTRMMHCTEEYLRDSRALDKVPEGDYVCLEVTDTGSGMSEETITKLFDPFFTTKLTGRGLGMSAVLGIIRSHKGAILVNSRPNDGTTIQALFPALACAVRHPVSQIPEVSIAAPKREGTILFVDDEPEMRGMTALMLEQKGYRAFTAADGLEALEIFNACAGDIDCVVLDLNMPRMDGGQALQELRRIQPDIPVILMSGYAEQEIEARFSGQGVNAFLAKPYSFQTLMQALGKTLG